MKSDDGKALIIIANQIQSEIDVKGAVKKVELTLEADNESIEIDQKYFCKTCDKIFTCLDFDQHNKSHKESQIDSQKSREKKQKCDICSKSFRYISELDRHKTIHSNDRPFKCTTCVKNFKLKVNLFHHMKIHTGEKQKPHTCKICSTGFLKPSHLERKTY